MLKRVTCEFCKGNGKAQTLEEESFSGDWVPNTLIPHDLADKIIADGVLPLRWRDCDCPICDGAGSYDLEFPRCKIF